MMKRNGDSFWLLATLGMLGLIAAVSVKKAKGAQAAQANPVNGLGRVHYPDGSWSKC